ncbi:hypothetical protein [Tenacibaculum jejuense]|uniref:Uncharacterized protein n=1 Tax=Tenacibaculum jejuense TaxID=584609 RepID=A0A238UBK7_9FLAO|nr:hypothetical protein [Tenacibaculum jejuense]SNR15800.1 protein of unknown function [Tenacibaculum jejuense]
MAKTFELTGVTSKKIVLEKPHNPAAMILYNVSPSAKVKVTITRNNTHTITLIPDLTVATLKESQAKMETLSYKTNHSVPLPFNPKTYEISDMPTTTANEVKKALTSVEILLAIGGEVLLNEGDKLTVTLSNLQKHDDSHVTFLGGYQIAQNEYSYKELTWKKEDEEIALELTDAHYLIMAKPALADKYEFIVPNQKITMYTRDLLANQSTHFGIVAYDQQDGAIFGTNSCVVLDVRSINSVHVTKENRTADIKYYTVNPTA